MGLIERLRHWPIGEPVKTYEYEFHIAETGNSYTARHTIPTSPHAAMREAADALERLKGYAVHDEDCALGLHGPACSCGLSALLREIDGC